MSDTPRTDALIYRKNTIEMQRHELLDLALALERELAEARVQLLLCNTDQSTAAAELANAVAAERERCALVCEKRAVFRDAYWWLMSAAKEIRLAEPAIKDSLTVQRPWVGLTEDEIWTLHDSDSYPSPVEFARAIEAKLKDKNGG